MDCIYSHACDGYATPPGLNASLAFAVEGAADWTYGYGMACVAGLLACLHISPPELPFRACCTRGVHRVLMARAV
jgi:hypothetical protein